MAQVTGQMWLLGRVFRPERECGGDLALSRKMTGESLASVWLTGFLGVGKYPSQTFAPYGRSVWPDRRRVDESVSFASVYKD